MSAPLTLDEALTRLLEQAHRATWERVLVGDQVLYTSPVRRMAAYLIQHGVTLE